MWIFLHACISYINRIHACKNGELLFKDLRLSLIILSNNHNNKVAATDHSSAEQNIIVYSAMATFLSLQWGTVCLRGASALIFR